MKKLLTILLLMVLATAVNATTWYVSPNGNDAGAGTQTAPWKTVRNALLTVNIPGDIIMLLPGTYTESTGTVNLALGVSLIGSGATTTIIKTTMGGQWSTFLNLESSTLSNGNQTISDITFDGSYVSETNYKTWFCIWITMRSNVTLKNCVFQNYFQRGIIINGNGRNEEPKDPGIYSTGIQVLNNKFLNCGGNDGNTYGQLNIGGTKDAVISGNFMDQTQRPGTRNGECIKYWGSGYNMGLKILNNTLKRANHITSYNGESGDWNFVVELFNNSGLEIAGNQLQGSLDINYNRVVAPYTYSVWIHHNVSDHSPANTREEQGIVFEFETTKAIVEDNRFYNMSTAITFNIRTPGNTGGYSNPMPVGGYSATTDVIIRNNLFVKLYNLYSNGYCCSQNAVQFYTEGETLDGYIRNFQFYNNTVVGSTVVGVDLTHFTNGTSPRADNTVIRNNIFVGQVEAVLKGGGSKMLNTVFKDNCVWNCANNNDPSWTGSLANTGTLKVNPGLDANYLVPAGSPIYGLGIGYNGTGNPPPPPTNQPPVANAGPDRSITLPTNSLTLAGSMTDPEGKPLSYTWKGGTGLVLSTGTGTSGSAVSLPLANLVQGEYDYTLTVIDDSGLVATDAAHVSVKPPVTTNTPPTADAGTDQDVTLSFTLTGTGSDAQGPVTYNWRKVSGPSGQIIESPAAATTRVLGIKKGTYIFELKVTDNQGLSKTDRVTVTVN